ncbi:copper-binding protein [Candidatus Roizmanbacteria bacterium CG02_land_8_20_14_3_00_36_15]|uniref:Copper-binding protein n=1 Tax=Candidatus Roizmanbacteria bacterium CG10_big_fil_rev_8_21_14_0_10_36_26 TaxID=1974851 RepID=A0A2M8KKT6_9BACT|nr:MAG: copper-binding protein [Candidatus Roizmanbacteria bacterium CG03_land_8_20_14_0_80_36_21]PIV37608.1 MAG: copper-binding protein [Candidatus Roizmanbacteria bacterium CG02_land_8_20_14_3_00_36_15]PJE60514.1 MAG: copper-binding protein [Candidatus Roizmanbacteria bacterium CG10_big_fil_rev_8_21_14_0_10_36_26]
MPFDKIIVLIFGLLSILFTYWYFFMKKQNTVEASGEVDILVDGGYKPDRISIPFGKTTKLIFERKDSNSCLEEVVLSDFKVRKFLPLNEKTEIEINPTKKGEFDFSCGMGMFHGKLIVK